MLLDIVSSVSKLCCWDNFHWQLIYTCDISVDLINVNVLNVLKLRALIAIYYVLYNTRTFNI